MNEMILIACSCHTSVNMPHLRIQGSAQQADIPEAGCVFLQLCENRWAGPGNPGRWTDSHSAKHYAVEACANDNLHGSWHMLIYSIGLQH